MTATDTDDVEADLEQHWVPVLAEYWRQADWEMFGGRQMSRANVFGTRVRVAKRQGDVHAALDKLAGKLGMAVPELPTKHLAPLVEHNDAAMHTLKNEHVWLVNLTDQSVTNYFAALDGDSSDDDDGRTTTDLSDFIATQED